jgi:hypothetical protein
MTLKQAMAAVVLAATVFAAGGPTAAAAAPSAPSGPARVADRALPPGPGPGTPLLKSAPLKGLPTLQEARKRGLLGEAVSAQGVSPRAWPAPSCTTPPQGWDYHDYLKPGECLREGSYIAAERELGEWWELWVDKGDLVLYQHMASGYTSTWRTGTSGWGVSAWMQHDGNFVIYDANGNPLWHLGTQGCGDRGAWLRVQADRNLVLYTRDWTPIWARFNGPSTRPC